MLLKLTMCSMCRYTLLFLLIGSAVGELSKNRKKDPTNGSERRNTQSWRKPEKWNKGLFTLNRIPHRIQVEVNKTSSMSQNSQILNKDTCVNDLRYRIRGKKTPTNITVQLIDDGKIIDTFYNDSTEMNFGSYPFHLNTTFVKNRTMIRVIVNGKRSNVTVRFRTSERGSCYHSKPTTTALYDSTTPTRQQKDGRTRVILPLIFVLALISALIMSFIYRKRLMMLYREIAGDHNIKQVRTISSERSSIPTQLNYVNAEHNVSNMQSGNMDDDYAELRTDDITYTVPDVRLSRASLNSFMSLKDRTEEDGECHLPMYSSMSALNEHYAQPGATISTTSMDSLSIPPITADDYMSMGTRFSSFSHHYDRPSSSQAMDNSKTATSRTCPQFYRDQEDYVAMFTQEEDYSNIGKALGESFRDKKFIRKYNKYNIKRKEHSKSETPDD